MARVLKLDGYIRVSQVRGREGDSFISPDVQRERISAWAVAYGHELAVVHEELDESGARSDRPKLLRAIERIEAGEINGLVVNKADRFGRDLLDGLEQIRRIRTAGGVFVAVADGLDTSTDTGKLVLHIMLSIAEHDLDKIRASWNDAKRRAVARGIHPSAVPPFGYRREGPPRTEGGGATGPLLPDPVNAPIVTELFQRCADGTGYTALARWLEDQGAITGYGRTGWSLRAVKDIVRNEVYLGAAFSRARQGPGGQQETFRNDAAHPPLTDHITFRRCQRRGVKSVPKADPSPIRPLLRCAGCRHTMRADRRAYKDGREVWLFTCRASGHNDMAPVCNEPARLRDAGQVEAWIVDKFMTGLDEHIARIRARSPEIDQLRTAMEQARGAFAEWRDDVRIQERLGMSDYLTGLEHRQDALNQAIAKLATAEAELDVNLPQIDNGLQVREIWPTLTRHEQLDLLQSTIRCVMVQGKASSDLPLDDRLHIVWQGAPVELPSVGNRQFVPRPFVPGTVNGDAVGLRVPRK